MRKAAFVLLNSLEYSSVFIKNKQTNLHITFSLEQQGKWVLHMWFLEARSRGTRRKNKSRSTNKSKVASRSASRSSYLLSASCVWDGRLSVRIKENDRAGENPTFNTCFQSVHASTSGTLDWLHFQPHLCHPCCNYLAISHKPTLHDNQTSFHSCSWWIHALLLGRWNSEVLWLTVAGTMLGNRNSREYETERQRKSSQKKKKKDSALGSQCKI